jgi:hypothetical protein
MKMEPGNKNLFLDNGKRLMYTIIVLSKY